MGQVKDQAVAAARSRDFGNAFLFANGLSMDELLGAMAAVGAPLLADMKAQSASSAGKVDMPRIQYAMQVVLTRSLPALAPGDLAATGQVNTARAFLQRQAGMADPTKLAAIIKALDEGRLIAEMNDVKGQLRGLARDGQWSGTGRNAGHILRAAPELISLLAGLLDNSATMTILSLFLYGNGPHGKPEPDGTAVGHAVDIAAYNGAAIHLKVPANAPVAIRGVAAAISTLPPGKYTLGLPRPGGGNLIDPPNDVFLPVTSLDQPQKSPSRGNFRKDLSLVLEPARTALTQAVDSNPAAKIQFLYPDGVDHLHVTTIA